MRTLLVILLGCVVASLLSCEQKKFVYEFLAFRNDNIKMWQDTLPIEAQPLIENGIMEMKDTDGIVIGTGGLQDGLKTGEWIYNPSPSQTLAVTWSIFDSSGVKLSYPAGWNARQSNECRFQAVFPIDSSEARASKYFIVVNQNKDSIKLTLKEYSDYYNNEFYTKELIKGSAHYVDKTYSGREYYFSRYIIEREGEDILMLSFLGEIENQIYDVAYGSLNKDNSYKHIVFFDMIRSMVFYNVRFFSPFDPVKEFRQYKFVPRMTDGTTS